MAPGVAKTQVTRVKEVYEKNDDPSTGRSPDKIEIGNYCNDAGTSPSYGLSSDVESLHLPAQAHDNMENLPAAGTRFRLILTLIVANATLLFVGLDNVIISTALPTIVGDLHQLNHVSWYGSAFLLGMATTQSFWGKVYTYWKIKHVYILAICIFEVGCILCATAKLDAVFIFGRSVAGVGSAGVMAGTFLITALVSSHAKRPRMVGLVSATLVVAAILGPPVGGAIVTRTSWRVCFYMNLPIGAVSVIVMALCLVVPDHAPTDLSIKDKVLHMDIPGMLLTLGSVTCLIQSTTWGGITAPWHSAKVIGCLVAAVILLALLVTTEIVSGKRAAINCTLLSQKNIAMQLPFGLTISSTFYLVLYYLPIYFQVVSGLDALQSGLRTLPLPIISGSISALMGFILSRSREYQGPMLLSGILAAIGSGLLCRIGPRAVEREYITYEVILALGTGVGYFLSLIVGQDIAEKAQLAQFNAMVLSLQLIANAVALAVGQSLFSNALLSALKVRAPTISAVAVLTKGPTALRTDLSPNLALQVVECYLVGLKQVFALATGLSCTAAVVSLAALLFDRRKLGRGQL